MSHLAAVILAAGRSSRMGSFKPLLQLNGKPALEHIVSSFRAADVHDISVVSGHMSTEIETSCSLLNVRCIHNQEYVTGMFSSVCACVRALQPDVSGFFLLPVDIPLVRPTTLRRLAADFSTQNALVTYPTFLGERGHPPLLSRKLIDPILSFHGKGGLRSVLECYEERARDVPITDQSVLLDMDNPEDHAALEKRTGLQYPLNEECEALYRLATTPEHTREHCRAVARVAECLIASLNRYRPATTQLDQALARSAALMHDIAKGQRSHAQAGAALLREHGFFSAAAVVADHPDLTLPESAPLTEREIVFLADKFVQKTRIVPITERYLARLQQYETDPEAVAVIHERLQHAETVLKRFFAETGHTKDSLLPMLRQAVVTPTQHGNPVAEIKEQPCETPTEHPL